MMRVRWAAVGAAVAVTLGAGGLAIARAATPPPATVFHALTPVRVFDTRDGTGGAPKAPIGPAAQIDIAFAGTNGIPADATSVVLNVSVVGGTAPSFLTVWPTGQTRPGSSSLNWSGGGAAVPNGVTVSLGAGGKLSFFNFAGSVDVFADLMGYYTLPQSGTGTNTGNAATANGATCVLGQILLTASTIKVAGGVPANGQILSIGSNSALFSLFGTTYGGDGMSTFALPDLRSVTPNNMTYSICVIGIYPA
jgi:hypothetical protein